MNGRPSSARRPPPPIGAVGAGERCAAAPIAQASRRATDSSRRLITQEILWARNGRGGFYRYGGKRLKAKRFCYAAQMRKLAAAVAVSTLCLVISALTPAAAQAPAAAP